MKKEKKKKQKFIDDGRTIYNMDVDGMPHRRKKEDPNGVYLTKKERKAAIIAAILHFMPILFGVILCFTIVMVLLYFWLK